MLDDGCHALHTPVSRGADTAGSFLLIGAGYAACYLVLFQAAKACEAFFSISLWYPPSGLRLAALLWFGWRFGGVALLAEIAAYLILDLSASRIFTASDCCGALARSP